MFALHFVLARRRPLSPLRAFVTMSCERGGYTMACEQAAQYREDIADLTALTTSKEARLHMITGIMFTCSIQLIMAGRLGQRVLSCSQE